MEYLISGLLRPKQRSSGRKRATILHMCNTVLWLYLLYECMIHTTQQEQIHVTLGVVYTILSSSIILQMFNNIILIATITYIVPFHILLLMMFKLNIS